MKGEKEIIRLLREEPGRGIELLAEQLSLIHIYWTAQS